MNDDLVPPPEIGKAQVDECYCGFWVEPHENPCPDCGLRRPSKAFRVLETLLGKVIVEIALVLLRWAEPTAEELNRRPGRHKYWTDESLAESRETQKNELREDVPRCWRLRLLGTPSSRRCLANVEHAIHQNQSRLYHLMRETSDDSLDSQEVRDSYKRQIDACLDKVTMLELFRVQNMLKPLVINGWTSMTHQDCLERLDRLAEIGKQLQPVKRTRSRYVHEFYDALLKRTMTLRGVLVRRSERLSANESSILAAGGSLVSSDGWFEAWTGANEFIDLLEES